MDSNLQVHLENLKNALLLLEPTGSEGFEGLLATVLGEIAGYPFRLAGSGSQHGKDGESQSRNLHLTFEGKLYSGHINKNEILSKLTELVAGAETPDLWVLGATIEIKTQILGPLQSAAKKNGIAILVLDWIAAAPIPPLAVACAAASDAALKFFRDHIIDKPRVKQAQAALLTIRDHNAFDTAAYELQRELSGPTLGLATALSANRQWLTSAFSDRKLARQIFGQPLAPLDQASLATYDRPNLVSAVQEAVFKTIASEVVVLSGGEGCGKSWLFAQSWLASAERPLTLVVSAADLKADVGSNDVEAFLIKQIITQTDGQITREADARWRNRLSEWKNMISSAHSQPTLVLFVDGLNQRPDCDWPRWIDGVGYYLRERGGRLVISVRDGYFRTRIKNALVSGLTEIAVTEWSDADLTAILSAKGVKKDTLSGSVLTTLRNPRVLGIAFELLDDNRIQDFRELSVERLLFEHIRKSARDGTTAEAPDVFTKRLASHASEIISRTKQQNHEDRLVFESADVAGAPRYELSSDLLSVAEGRFFSRLVDDPTLYTLTDDGLVLALGLSILAALQKAHRNGRDVAEELDVILEPVAALDRTAETVFAALLVGSIDERCNDQIRCALFCAYLRLQNVPEYSYPAFASAVRNAVDAAMKALGRLSTSPAHTEHSDWLITALRESRGDAASWAIMGRYFESWLTEYSLDPELAVFESRQEDLAAHQAKVAERDVILKEKIRSFSQVESDFVAGAMHRKDNGVSSTLGRNVFDLMAGMPLSQFGGALVAWTFSQALNSDFRSPYDEFLFLIRFNTKDWSQTRDALLQHSAMLGNEETSPTGKWALVHILRATSTEEDAATADRLVAELTADQPKFEGWRLVENYCASDPCDPTSEMPPNISETAKQYGEIDLTKIRAFLSTGREDHFLQDARPGLARFAPQVAVSVHKVLLSQIALSGDDAPNYRFLSLREDTALLPEATLRTLIETAKKFSRPRLPEDKESRDAWIKSQYALLVSLPHMDGCEQLETLLSLPHFGPPLLDLADVLKPANDEALEQALDRCAQSDDANFKMTVLMFARHSGTSLSERSRQLIKRLTSDTNSAVRALALDVLLPLKDRDFVKSFAESAWDANSLDSRENHFERWYGARVIADAVSQEILTPNEALNRVAPEHYQFIARAQKGKKIGGIPERLNASVGMMLDAELPFQPPMVEHNLSDRRKAFDAPMKSLVESERKLELDEFLKRINETSEEFDARQERGWQAYERFEAALTKDRARLIIEHTGRTAVRACVESNPEIVADWAQQFIGLSDQKLRRIHNFGLIVAEALSRVGPELGASLFRRLRGSQGYVNIVSGAAAIPLESLCLWNSADADPINALRAERLDTAITDQAISQEVLAANIAERQALLRQYVEDRLGQAEPVSIARALMVCGLGLETEDATTIIARYANSKGLIGKAAEAARYAYDRNRWSRHWFEKMCSAASNDDFWRYSVLFLKIVDARYELWPDASSNYEQPMRNFGPSVWKKTESRIKSWQDKRAKTLFGFKAPGPLFVSRS